ncbi:MAG: amino acid adenylation domain-containing protein [Halanaerobiales bacterium]|nr:amino acid adenylation domain-containing protein [Halanaerobiales bacterium]
MFLRGGNLELEASKDVLTPKLVKEIKNNKLEIIDLLKAEKRKAKRKPIQIRKAEERDYYPVSSAQKRMLVMHQMEKSNLSYNLLNGVVLEGDLDLERLEQAFRKLIERHEALRTAFLVVDNEYVQKIHKQIDFSIVQRECSQENLNSTIKHFIRSMDLSKPPLFEVAIIKFGSNKNVFLINIHHIICDGTSFTILVKELLELYNEKQLAAPKLQYKDFTLWQIEQNASERFKKQEQYWLELFAGDEIPVLDLPTDSLRSDIQAFEGEKFIFSLDQRLAASINELVQKTNSSKYMVLLAIYNILLYKYSGQKDIIVGSSIAKRGHYELQNVIGMMVNALAMRNYPDDEKRFIDFLTEVRTNALKAYENQDYPFDELVDQLKLRRGNNPLFNTMFEYHNLENRKMEMAGLKVLPLEYNEGIARFDLELNVIERAGEINVGFHYSARLFERSTIERMGEHFTIILEHITSNPEILLGDIDLLSNTERDKILVYFNQTERELPPHQTVIDLFECQVAKRPDDIAVECGDESLTYRELAQRVNQLTGYLLNEHKVQKEELVAILMDRSINMLVAILSVFKAGGAYIPLDAAYPEKRIQTILDDAEIRLVLGEEKYVSLLDSLEQQCEVLEMYLCMDSENQLNLASYSDIQVENRSKPGDLAYVIYTSGSTGKPKGAMVEQIGMVNHMFAKINDLSLDENSIVAQNSSHSFDISVWQFMVALVVGGKTMIYPNQQVLNVEKFIDQVICDQVSILEVVPSYLKLILDLMDDQKPTFHTLKYLLVTGEALQYKLVKRWLEKYPDIYMVNAYGPTEASDDITHNIIKEVPASKSISIGKPLQNFKIYIVNEKMQLCPIGVKGEIVVAGLGVGRGYVNAPEKTAVAFTVDPFRAQENVRLYKTGDLGRWLPDGNIEFFGRKDHQVKIRGFRIELGEIENVLMEHENIKEAVVLAKENDQYIYAYIVYAQKMDLSKLKTFLKDRLPEYMIPSYFVEMEKIPLTPNEKINRKALPEPQIEQSSIDKYEAPRNEMEERLTQIFCEILGIEDVGINDTFFDLGGDSIKAMILMSKIKEAGLHADITEFFSDPTIKGISKNVQEVDSISHKEVIEGEVPLMPIQQWFFERNFTDSHHYNRSYRIFRKEGFDVEMVRIVFAEILKHHDALRMVYRNVAGRIIQYNQGIKNCLPDIQVINLGNGDFDEEANELNRSINMATGPLVKIGIIKGDSGDYLQLVVHRVIADTYSMKIILQDFITGMKSYLKNEKIEFPAKTHSYQHWVEALKEVAQSPEIESQILYWKNIEDASVSVLEKDSDIPRTMKKLNNKLSVRFTLDEIDTAQLLTKVLGAFEAEVGDVLLSALYLSLQKWTGFDRFMLYMGGHGRENIVQGIDISRTVGWFTAQYPVLLSKVGGSDFHSTIKQVKEIVMNIPQKGIGYGMLRYLNEDQKDSFNLEPEISFNYLGEVIKSSSDDFGGLFQLADNGNWQAISPNMERHFPLDVVCGIRDGAIRIDLNFSDNEFKVESINRLAEYYKDFLLQIIEDSSNTK